MSESSLKAVVVKSWKRNLVSLGAVVIVLVGCASAREVLETGVPVTFVSTMSVPMLTTCIDRNTDGAILNSLQTNIKNSGIESSEIVVRNGDFVYAVVQVKATNKGSIAAFRLGGVAIAPETSVKRMTKGCE